MKIKTPLLLLILSFTLSCIIDIGDPQFSDDFSALPSVSLSSALEPNSHWLYIDLDESYYTNSNHKVPLYEINTTDEYGDTLSNRRSLSSPEDPSPSNCEIEFDPDIDISEQATKDIYCIMDVMEDEFDILDLVLIYNIPDGMCHHVKTYIPWHFNQEIGNGPQTIYRCPVPSGTADENGSCETEERYFLSVSDCPTLNEGNCRSGGGTGRNGREGIQEFCAAYDKSNQTGKGNCCFGEYVVLDINDGNAEVENGEWGGDFKTCIGGPGRTSWEHFNEDGVPVPLARMANDPNGGYREKFIVKSIQDIFGGTIYPYSLVWANYIKSLDVESSHVPSRGGTAADRKQSFTKYRHKHFSCSLLFFFGRMFGSGSRRSSCAPSNGTGMEHL